MGSSKSVPNTSQTTKQSQIPSYTSSSSQQKKPHVVTKTKEYFFPYHPNRHPKSSQQQILSDKEINGIVDSVSNDLEKKDSIMVEDYFMVLTKQVRQNQFLLEVKGQREMLTKKYLRPLAQSYNEIPETITALKFTYLNCFGYNDRLTALGLASMIVGVASFRTARIHQIPTKAFGAIKDAAVAYFVGGLVIAPEIFNPLMNE